MTPAATSPGTPRLLGACRLSSCPCAVLAKQAEADFDGYSFNADIIKGSGAGHARWGRALGICVLLTEKSRVIAIPRIVWLTYGIPAYLSHRQARCWCSSCFWRSCGGEVTGSCFSARCVGGRERHACFPRHAACRLNPLEPGAAVHQHAQHSGGLPHREALQLQVGRATSLRLSASSCARHAP